MKVYIVHANWLEREWFKEVPKDTEVFSTKEKALTFIKHLLVSHKFYNGYLPILRYKKKAITVDTVMAILEKEKYYLNDWFGDDHIQTFYIKILEQELE